MEQKQEIIYLLSTLYRTGRENSVLFHDLYREEENLLDRIRDCYISLQNASLQPKEETIASDEIYSLQPCNNSVFIPLNDDTTTTTTTNTGNDDDDESNVSSNYSWSPRTISPPPLTSPSSSSSRSLQLLSSTMPNSSLKSDRNENIDMNSNDGDRSVKNKFSLPISWTFRKSQSLPNSPHHENIHEETQPTGLESQSLSSSRVLKTTNYARFLHEKKLAPPKNGGSLFVGSPPSSPSPPSPPPSPSSPWFCAPIQALLTQGKFRVQEFNVIESKLGSRHSLGTLHPCGFVVSVQHYKIAVARAEDDAVDAWIRAIKSINHENITSIFIVEFQKSHAILKLCTEYFDTSLDQFIYNHCAGIGSLLPFERSPTPLSGRASNITSSPARRTSLLIVGQSLEEEIGRNQNKTRLCEWRKMMKEKLQKVYNTTTEATHCNCFDLETSSNHARDTSFSTLEILHVVEKIASALHYLHHSYYLIHGDVQSKNCFLRIPTTATQFFDDSIVIKLGGFEYMKKSDGGSVHRACTPWVAPEVLGTGSILEFVHSSDNIIGQQKQDLSSKKLVEQQIELQGKNGVEISIKSDIWSLGMLIFELATLHQPYHWNNTEPFGLAEHISSGSKPSFPPHWTHEYIEKLNLKRVIKLFDVCTTFQVHKRPDASAVLKRILKYSTKIKNEK
jgi:hypothetical protein